MKSRINLFPKSTEKGQVDISSNIMHHDQPNVSTTLPGRQEPITGRYHTEYQSSGLGRRFKATAENSLRQDVEP